METSGVRASEQEVCELLPVEGGSAGGASYLEA